MAPTRPSSDSPTCASRSSTPSASPQRLPSPARHAAPEEWGALEFLPLDEGRYPGVRRGSPAAAGGGNRGDDPQRGRRGGGGGLPGRRIAFCQIADDHCRRGRADGATERSPALDGILALDAEVRSALTAQLGRAGRLMDVLGTIARLPRRPGRPGAGPRARPLRRRQAGRDHGPGVRRRLSAANRLGRLAWHALLAELDPARRLREDARRGRRQRGREDAASAASPRRPSTRRWTAPSTGSRSGCGSSVLLAGVVMNFLLAGVLFAVALACRFPRAVAR